MNSNAWCTSIVSYELAWAAMDLVLHSCFYGTGLGSGVKGYFVVPIDGSLRRVFGGLAAYEPSGSRARPKHFPLAMPSYSFFVLSNLRVPFPPCMWGGCAMGWGQGVWCLLFGLCGCVGVNASDECGTPRKIGVCCMFLCF